MASMGQREGRAYLLTEHSEVLFIKALAFFECC
jgi:hypothetical protein